MNSRTRSKFDQTRLLTTELAAIERQKNPHRPIMRERFATFSRLFFILAGNDGIH